MAEKIVVDFIADVEEYQRQIDDAIESTEDLEKAALKGAKKGEDAYQGAARKRSQLIEREKRLLKELRRSSKLAFDPKTIDAYNRKIRESEQRLRSLEGVGKKAGSSLNTVFGRVAGGLGVAAAGAGVVALGQKAIKAAADYEKLQVSFATFLGSAEKGQKVLNELDKFSLKTPFEPEQVFEAGKALLAFGIEQENLIDVLGRVGDISSATGKDFNELAVIYGKARVQGTLFAEDINQLTEAGIDVIGAFADQFQRPTDEIKKLGSEGKITFENLEQAFIDMTSRGGKFFGLTNKLATTTAGKLSTLSGKATELARTIGQSLQPAFNAFLDLLIGTDSVTEAVDEFRESTDAIKEFDEVLVPLIDRYDELSEKTSLTNEEQDELQRIIEKIGDEIPTAITAFDSYGNAIDISSERARLFREELVKLNEVKNQDALADARRELNLLGQEAGQLNKDLNRFDEETDRLFETVNIQTGRFGDTFRKRFLSAEEIEKKQADLKKIQDRIDGINSLIRELQGLPPIVVEETEQTEDRRLNREEIRKKSLEELNELRKKELALNDNFTRLNILLIDEQIAALQKLEKEQAKKNEKDRKAREKEQAEKDKQAKADIERERKKQEALTKATQDGLNRRFKEEAEYQKNIRSFQEEQRLRTAASGSTSDRVRFAQTELLALAVLVEQEVAFIQTQVDAKVLTELEGQSLITDIYRTEIKERSKLLQALNITEADLIRGRYALWIENNRELLQSSFELFSALTELQAAQNEQALEDIQKRREADDEYYQNELDNLEELRDTRRITEDEYQRRKEETTDAQLAAEKKLERETAKIRQREAVAQKAQALFQIALHTAEAVAEASPDPFRIALAIAIGAAQAAAAASTPIPKFARGTKGSPEGLAMVGEQGPEMVYLPRNTKVLPADKTKKYAMSHGDLVEAMREDRLEDFLHAQYIAPELQKQKETLSLEREIVTRIQPVAPGLTYYDLVDANKKGTRLKNVNELAQAIAEAIKKQEGWQ